MIDSARLFRALPPLQASPQLHPESEPPQGDSSGVEGSEEAPQTTASALEPDSPAAVSPGSDGDYAQLQRRLIRATLIVSAIAVLITALLFDLHIATSLLVGGLGGVLYLWLLSRSVGKLGKGSKTVGKTQLLVPVVLVLASSRLPQLELLPVLLGFLLYKPALILQTLLDFRAST
ncbi:MAG: ATP synthase [Synechococcaceae bacterium WB8_1B_136]|nr:ATP synthase [Synechococcaceae bacterium WB8_1B_136]